MTEKVVVKSRDTQATGRFVQRSLVLSDGSKPVFKRLVDGKFEEAVSKVNEWETGLVAAINKGLGHD